MIHATGWANITLMGKQFMFSFYQFMHTQLV